MEHISPFFPFSSRKVWSKFPFFFGKKKEKEKVTRKMDKKEKKTIKSILKSSSISEWGGINKLFWSPILGLQRHIASYMVYSNYVCYLPLLCLSCTSIRMWRFPGINRKYLVERGCCHFVQFCSDFWALLKEIELSPTWVEFFIYFLNQIT